MSNYERLPVAPRNNDFGLNSLEIHLIALTAAGYTSDESTQRLGIVEQALQQHLVNIYDKLRVSNQLELILFCLYHQLVDSAHLSPPAQ